MARSECMAGLKLTGSDPNCQVGDRNAPEFPKVVVRNLNHVHTIQDPLRLRTPNKPFVPWLMSSCPDHAISVTAFGAIPQNPNTLWKANVAKGIQ